EGVHHAVAVEAVELPVTLTGRGPGLVATLVEVVDRPRLRTRRGDRGAFQDRAHLLRREAEVGALTRAVLRHDQRGHTSGVRRRHRGALQRLVVGVLAVRGFRALDAPFLAELGDVTVLVDRALGQRHVIRVRREDEVRVLPVVRRAVVVAEVTTRRGHRDPLGAVAGVVRLRLRRAERRHVDHVRALGRHAQAGVVVDLPFLGAVRREVRARGVRERVAAVLVLVAQRRHQGDALAVRVLQRPGHRFLDGALLRLLRRRVRRVVVAVVQPRVDVEAHVHHVDAVVTGVGQRVDHRLQEEVAGVHARAQVDQGDVRGDTGDTEVVGRRTDGGRDVRAVAVVVVVVGVDAATELARPVHHFAVRIGRHVDGEVARQVLVEVRRDVRVVAVHTGVDDADANLLVTRLYVARQVGADHGQAPQLVVHRVHGRAGAALLGGLGGLALLDLARAVLTLD